MSITSEVISRCVNHNKSNLDSFNRANFRIQSYILLYFDFGENDALKLAKKYVFVRFKYSPGTFSAALRYIISSKAPCNCSILVSKFFLACFSIWYGPNLIILFEIALLILVLRVVNPNFLSLSSYTSFLNPYTSLVR